MASQALKIRPLTEAEVTFTVEIEPEDLEVRGQFDSGDEEQDKALVDTILERLDRGDIAAWCCLKVTATWEGYTGTTYLGGCSFADDIHMSDQAQAIECADEHGMQAEALADLNETIQHEALRCLELINKLKVG